MPNLQPPLETYEHAVSVGKAITVLALDYDRCGKLMASAQGRAGGMASANTNALARLLYGLDPDLPSSHLRLVSFSNRQSDFINTEYFGDEPRVNLEHLDKADAILHEYARHYNVNLTSSVDKRYFLDERRTSAFADKGAFKAYVQADRKQELAAKIRAAYPNAAKIVFVDDDWESLPQPVVDKVYVVHFSPMIQDPKTVRVNEKAF